jgi:hypothetical protein
LRPRKDKSSFSGKDSKGYQENIDFDYKERKKTKRMVPTFANSFAPPE